MIIIIITNIFLMLPILLLLLLLLHGFKFVEELSSFLLRLSKSLCNWITGLHRFWYCCLRQQGFSTAFVLFCRFRLITIVLYDHTQQRLQGNIAKWKNTYGFYLRSLNRRTFLTIAIFVSDTNFEFLKFLKSDKSSSLFVGKEGDV